MCFASLSLSRRWGLFGIQGWKLSFCSMSQSVQLKIKRSVTGLEGEGRMWNYTLASSASVIFYHCTPFVPVCFGLPPSDSLSRRTQGVEARKKTGVVDGKAHGFTFSDSFHVNLRYILMETRQLSHSFISLFICLQHSRSLPFSMQIHLT